MQTLYDMLKVQEDAPLEVIRAAYKVLSSKYHPDKNPGDSSAAEMMQKINRAYNILRDPEARARYDAALKRTRDQQQTKATRPQFDETEAQPPSSGAHTSPSSDTPATQSFGETVGRIWSGRMGLCKTYWIYGVLASCIWGIALRFVTPGSALAITLVLAFVIYLVVINTGIWRAADRYTGYAIWAILAKIAVAGPIAALVVGTAAAVILPAYQDYKAKAASASQPAPDTVHAFDPTTAEPVTPLALSRLLAWPMNGQKLPREYQPRVAVLRKAAESGALSLVNIRPPSATDGLLEEWPSNEVATIENQQTWWIAADVVGIHVDNRSMRRIGMIEIKHATTECALAPDSSFVYYSLPLERPVESATQAIIQFRSGDQIPQANGCLIVTRIRG